MEVDTQTLESQYPGASTRGNESLASSKIKLRSWQEALKEYLASLNKNRAAAAGYEHGFEATVLAIKANEAITNGRRIVLQNEWFEI